MIPILYKETETEFSSNGIGAMTDTIRCIVTEERNGMYEAEMVYPVSGQFFKEIMMSRYIATKPNSADDMQPFQIYKISKPINGRITIYARHNRYQMNHIPVSPFEADGIHDALEKIRENAAEPCPFQFETDIVSDGKMLMDRPYMMSQILGGVEGSLLDRYGGEYRFDRYKVQLLARRGKDNGVTIRYGKNLTDLKQEESIENTITGVYPYWTNADGEYVELPEKVVRSENEKYFPFPRTIPMDFSDEFQEKPTEDELRKAAEKYIENNKIGTPSVSLDVSYIQLEQTQEYKHMEKIDKVSMCDEVTIEFEKLGVSAKAKIIRTVYDSLKEKYEKLEIGDAKTNLATQIIEQKKEIEKKPSVSVVNKYIDSATQLITGNKGGYIVFRLNEEKKPYELLIMDNENIEKAKNVWRFNLSGFGHSSTGYEGPYPLAITQDGKIVADFITAGTMLADRIRGGTFLVGGKETAKDGNIIVQDKDGNVIGKCDSLGIEILKGLIKGGKIRSTNFVEGESGMEFDLDNSELTSYITDDKGNHIKMVMSNAGVTIKNLSKEDEELRILFAAAGDSYTPVISAKRGENKTEVGATYIAVSRGTGNQLLISYDVNGKRQIQLDDITIEGQIRAGGKQGKTGRAEFSDGTYMEFQSGILVGGYTTEGGDI